MSATTTPTTFLDLFTDLMNRVRADTTVTAEVNIAKRYINQALHDLHIQQNWSWAERLAVLQTHAIYTTGTVSIALATRTTVTGTSTVWTTAVTGMGFNNARVGGKMTFAGGTDVYTVSAVGAAGTITLADRYVRTTALTDATYVYFEDEYALASDFFRLVDARSFDLNGAIPIISRQEFYRRYPRNATTGSPRVATLVELGPSGSVTPRQRVILHPAPDIVYNIPYRYVTSNLAVSSTGTFAANLSADTDEPIIPLRYRHILVAYAAYVWLAYRKDDARAAEAQNEYVDLVKRIANDAEPQRDRPRFVSARKRYLATAAGPTRRTPGRYGTGSWFDELRDR